MNNLSPQILETILTINGISKKYGKVQAVNNLSVTVKKGQVFGILGPNGSGKTTTLSIILDLLKPDEGDFEWFGAPPSKESRKHIGSVIESPNFFPYLDACQNLQIVADIKDMDYDDIDRVLTMTDLISRKHSKFRTFSFGMKQRLAIASALLGNPDVLILDEPTNGLDPQGIASIRELILQVASQGITIIMASHLLDEVQKICSHVAVLHKGKQLFNGNVSEVLAISDSFEIASETIPELEKLIVQFPGFKSLKPHGENLQVYFSTQVNPGEINRFCQQHGILLTHLSERKRSLEQHFLELLQDNQ